MRLVLFLANCLPTCFATAFTPFTHTNLNFRTLVFRVKAVYKTTTETIETLHKLQRQRQRERHQTRGLMGILMAVHVRSNSWFISLLSSVGWRRRVAGFIGF